MTASVELEAEEVTFSNGPVRLSGTVIYPAGPGPFPGMVFLRRAVVATAFHGAPRVEATAVWQEVRDGPWAFPIPNESHSYWRLSRRVSRIPRVAAGGAVRSGG
jgi:hypothetical protein